MEEYAIPANHDFVPMDVGNSEPDRARVEIAHDETREEPGPGLHQEAQIVLILLLRSTFNNNECSISNE